MTGGSPQPSGRPRFSADRNLGRLARWLRLLGYDTRFLAASTRATLLAEREAGRTVLTRLRSLQGEPGVVFIAADSPSEQLRQLAAALPLEAEPRLSRCSVCNTPLAPAPAQEVEARVPEHVRLTQRRFRRCPTCGRIYWPGSHLERMRAHLAQALAGP